MVAATLFVLPFFFLAAPLVTAEPDAVARQTSNSDCASTAACMAYNAALGTLDDCTQTVIQNEATCLTCQVTAGGSTLETAQIQLNGSIDVCGDEGKPVDPITLPFNGSVASGTGTGSAPAASGTAPSPPAGSSPAAAKPGSALGAKCGTSTVVASVLVILSFTAMFV
ncbi:hypothetical protein GGX14DRAFT_480043 [Mycena pura]|uniref:Uncharacterized protein n=1 Tax=Mycena pura TaxID=153505 RepID=A0AAD6Y3F1_9AGAR|nr:hypothetical protein GGX14DRAFT_480043 [Mycena pura]